MKVLQFSGGIDSLACLELLKDTPGLAVVTISTDGAYPDREGYLYRVMGRHPHLKFFHIKTDRMLEKFGHPVDVVPSAYTFLGSITQETEHRYQSHFDCCNRSIWQPLHGTMKDLGATEIFRGQRNDDGYRSPIKDGQVYEGVTYRLPIADWTRPQVMDFLNERCPDLIPSYYDTELSSHDCIDCTAYLSENFTRIQKLPEPIKSKVIVILDQWRADVEQETRW